MAFKPLAKPARTNGVRAPMITIGRSRQNRQTYLSLNKSARAALGDPAAVSLAWDQENLLLLVSAASPDDPDSYSITATSGRCSVTSVMRNLGLTPDEAHAMPAKRHGTTGLVIDVSGIRTATVTKVGRAA